MSKLPMEGIRILEFGQLLAVPHATKLLCDMGAAVIKVETTVRLNAHRSSSFLDNEPGQQFWNRAANYNDQNRNKLEITLDLTKPEGRKAAQELAMISDIVCENFTSRVMRNFGLDYDSLSKLKPDIIMLSSTGYGHTGPWAGYSAAGSTTEAASGLLWITGYPDRLPRLPSIPYTDFVGAQHGAFAIMAALHYRQLTGKGQLIDLSQSETASAQIGEVLLDYIANGHSQERTGNRHPYMAPHGCYPCAGDDQWVGIAVGTEEEWQGLCAAMDKPDWSAAPRFATPLLRHQNQDEMDRRVSAWTSQRDHYEVMRLLQEHGVPAGAVLTNKELLLDPHYKAREFFQIVEHAPESGIGRRPYPGVAWRFSKTPGSLRHPAPLLGQDNERILSELLGRSGKEIEELAAAGVTGKAPTRAAPPRAPSLEAQKKSGAITDYDPDYKAILGI
ncbi:MAG: CoA transferase [Chloroflexi bacterium]|nr:CoA transferase [Chloroflexota bacterium]